MLYYDCLSEFKRQFYHNLLTHEHLASGQIKINKVSMPDGSEDEEYNFWGYQFEKDGIKYLLSAVNSEGKELHLKDVLPIRAKGLLKVASRGIVYYHIKEPVSMKFKPEKTMEFKDFINFLSSLRHTNQTHQRLMWFMAITQMYDRANFRVTTPAGFGKDSIVDILGNLVGNCATIENPTLAKLEYMTNYKWLGVNEVIDIGKAEWRIIEQFLLASGAHKPEITKHSRAVASGVKEIMDISHFSLSLFYNDIDHYIEDDKYFDIVTKGAVKDRFPAFRLYGNYIERFNNVKDMNVKAFVKEHFKDYIELIHNYEFYRLNYKSYIHNYKTDGLISMPERWKTNMGRLLSIIDVYCDTQEEYTQWIAILNSCMNDYKAMLVYTSLLEQLYKKLGIPKSTYKDFKYLKDVLVHVSNDRDKYNYVANILSMDTFLQKNILINNYKPKQVFNNGDSESFWN